MVRFAVALPWWGYALAFAAALIFAWFAYARPAVPLTTGRRVLLTALRALTLLLIVVVLLRPVRFVAAEGASDNIVAILVDGSRSMGLSVDGGPRIDRARGDGQQLHEDQGTRCTTDLLG